MSQLNFAKVKMYIDKFHPVQTGRGEFNLYSDKKYAFIRKSAIFTQFAAMIMR